MIVDCVLDIEKVDALFNELGEIGPKLSSIEKQLSSVVTQLNRRVKKVKPCSEVIHPDPFLDGYHLGIERVLHHGWCFSVKCEKRSRTPLPACSALIQLHALKHVEPLLEMLLEETTSSLDDVQDALNDIESENCPLCGK